MRKRWLGLAALLVGGGAVDVQVANAQYPSPLPSGSPPMSIAPPGAPYQAPYQPIPGYSAAGPGAPGAMPGAMPGTMPGAMPGAIPGGPPMNRPVPGSPTGMHPGMYPPMGPAAGMPMGMGPMGPMLPPSPTVPMVDYGPMTDAFRPSCFGNQTLFVRADFTSSWITPGTLNVPLLTTGSVADPFPGALNPANRSKVVLYGGQGIDYEFIGGAKLLAGVWLDQENRYSIDVIGNIWSPTTVNYTAISDGNGTPLIARPIINAAANTEQAFLVALPGVLSGTTMVNSRAEMWNAEINARRHSYWDNHHGECFIGFKSMNLRESIRIEDNVTDLNGGFATYKGTPLAAGDRIYESDFFQTTNQFYGFQLGTSWTCFHEWFSFNLYCKGAVGVNEQTTNIQGFTHLTSPTLGNSTAPGGVLAQISNMGQRHQYIFGVIPEAGAQLGFDVHKCVRIIGGYNLLYWNNVTRPGDLIDRNVNVGLPPGSPVYGSAGPQRPSYVTRDQSLFIHTFNVGVEFHY